MPEQLPKEVSKFLLYVVSAFIIGSVPYITKMATLEEKVLQHEKLDHPPWLYRNDIDNRFQNLKDDFHNHERYRHK